MSEHAVMQTGFTNVDLLDPHKVKLLHSKTKAQQTQRKSNQ